MAQNHFGYKNKKDFYTFLLCWVGYFSTYVGRLNYSAVMPELQSGQVFSDSRIASISSAFFICYGVGQFISGIVGDRLDTRKMVFWGLLVSAVCNGFLYFAPAYPLFLLLWALNGFAQSLVWSPILKIASLNFDAPTRDKFGIDMSTTVPIGTLLSYALSLVTLVFLPWNYVFLTCGAFEGIVALIWLFGTKNLFRSKAEKAETAKQAPVRAAGFRETAKLMASSGALLLMIPIVIQGTLKDSVTQWVPTFFASTFGSKTTFSLALTMLLPIVNVTGAYFAKYINRKLHNEINTSLVFFSIAAAFLLLLKFAGSKSIVLSLVSMAAVTNCMFAVNVMLITIVPLRFSKSGRVSTIGGLLNAVAYIGCGGLNLLAGKLLETALGWSALFWMWIGIAVLAVLISLVCIPMWKRFNKAQEN